MLAESMDMDLTYLLALLLSVEKDTHSILDHLLLYLLSLSALSRLMPHFNIFMDSPSILVRCFVCVSLFTAVNGDPRLLSLSNGASFDPTQVTQLSWHPRAFIYRKFLTEEECDHLITLAKDKLEISMVADDESGQSIVSTVRTSSGMFLDKAQDDIVADIESRIAAWTFLPVENGESIQILRYERSQKYEPHYDYFHDKVNQQRGGHRIATVLMYLSNVGKGGETVFPNVEGTTFRPKGDQNWSDCAITGYAVKPSKGDALLFFSLHPDAHPDTTSLHGSCPVIEGEKWSATKWIHVRSLDYSSRGTDSGKCEDEDVNCPSWAERGECQNNPNYMVGSDKLPGYCRKSCKVCSA